MPDYYMLYITTKRSHKWLKVEATSPENALDIAKDWASENIVNLDYTVEVYSCKPTTDNPYDTFCLKAEFHFPTNEVKIPAERFFQRSEKKSKTFYVTIYHPDGSRFTSLEYKAETPEAALEKAKVYMTREWDGIEIYRAVVKEKQNRQVLLDRVVSQEKNDPTDEEKALENKRFQSFMRDWNAIHDHVVQNEVYLTEKDRAKLNWIDSYLGLNKLRESEEAEVRKESLDSYFEEEIPGEAETLATISNATNLYRAANELIQISKQLTEVANSLLSAK